MKKAFILSLFVLLIFNTAFACEMTSTISFAGCSSTYKVKDKCEVVRQETSKIVLPLDNNKDVVCLSKIEQDNSIILTYDDAGIIRKVIFKKCKKNKMKNDLYCLSKTVLYREIKYYE